MTVDVSIAQNSLLELKIVAISHLQSYQDYLILLGEVASDSLNRYVHSTLRHQILPITHGILVRRVHLCAGSCFGHPGNPDAQVQIPVGVLEAYSMYVMFG